MTLLANINVGSSPNDGTGDSLRTSFTKCNDNFQILDALATEFTSGNLNTNVISNGTSTFNNVNISGNVISSGNITSNYFLGNGSALTNVAAVTANSAAYAAQITGNTQANITTVGTLGNLTVAGTILTNLIEGATIGNSGASLVGTITTASQPNITSVGNLTLLNFSSPSEIVGLNLMRYNVSNLLDNTSLTTANLTMSSSSPSFGAIGIGSNITISYQSITLGAVKHFYVKNTSGATRYIILPNNNNNKGSNTIPVSNGTVATFNFVAFDTTSANVLATVIND